MRDLAPAIAVSLLLHLIVIGLIGFTWSSDPALQRTPKIPPHITAVVMEKEKKASKPPAKKPAPKPVAKPQPKPEKKPAPKPEQKPAPKPRPEPAKPVPKPTFDEPSLAEMLAEEELELEAMKPEAETVEAPAEAAGPSDEDLAEIASYEQAIKAAINLRWIIPSSLQAHDGLHLDVRIRTLPGGEVIDASVIRSSGHAVLDDSAVNAIRKASPLPVPSGSNYERFRVFTMRMTPDFAKTE